MLLWLHTYVSSVCFECFRCFRLMLQVFHLNVTKIDLDVAYVVMAIHACFKCFIHFRRMLQVFHLDVSKLDLGGTYVAICMVLLLRGSSCRRGSPRRLVLHACVCVTTPPAGSDVAWVTVPPVGAAGVACTSTVVAAVCVHADV
jgi:hypothetical protein